MKNKKAIMFVASLLILIFHFWIYISSKTSSLFKYELFIRQICFIGVDIFFFISAFSIYGVKKDNYLNFIKKRFIKVYLLFIIFSFIAFFYNKWSLKELILTILGISLFIKGGGAFLWFVPAIMLVYILLPLYGFVEEKNKYILPIIVIIWVILAFTTSNYTSYKEIFILLNRVPIILLGYYFSKCKIIDKLGKKKVILLSIIGSISGILLLYYFLRGNFYIRDFYYVLAIPLVIGIILLVNEMPKFNFINKIGSITLEIYALQMTFGFDIANLLSRIIVNNNFLANMSIIAIIIVISLLINYGYTKLLFYGNILINKVGR